MKILNTLAVGVTLFATAMQANASLISFINLGSDEINTSFVYGDLTVTGGHSKNNKNLANANFSLNQIVFTDIIKDHGSTGGFGVCSESPGDCSGATDSFSSNTNGTSKRDEILFFKFEELTNLESVLFNGPHTELVDHDGDDLTNTNSDALFNIFSSDDGMNYSSVFGGQVQPTGYDYLDVVAGSSKLWAVAATGWGEHHSYVAGIKASPVSAPSTLALLGLALMGLASRRKNKCQ